MAPKSKRKPQSLKKLRSIWESRFHSGLRELTETPAGVPLHGINARPLITSIVMPDATIRVEIAKLEKDIELSLTTGEMRSYNAAIRRLSKNATRFSPKSKAQALALVVHSMKNIEKSDKVVLPNQKLRQEVFSHLQEAAKRGSLRFAPGGASAHMLSAVGRWKLGSGVRPIYHGPFVPYLFRGNRRELLLPECDFLYVDGKGKSKIIPYGELVEGNVPDEVGTRVWDPSDANFSVQFKSPEGRDERLILRNPANTANQAIGISRSNRVLLMSRAVPRGFSMFSPTAIHRTRRGDIERLSAQVSKVIQPVSMEVSGTGETGKAIFKKANHLGLNEKELSSLVGRDVDISDPASLKGAISDLFNKSERLEALTLHTEHGQVKVLKDSVGDNIVARGILASGIPSTALGIFHAFPGGRPTGDAVPSALQGDLRQIQTFNRHLRRSGLGPVDPSETIFHDATEGLYMSYVPKAVFRKKGRVMRARAITGAGDTTGLVSSVVFVDAKRKARLRAKREANLRWYI